MNKQFYTTICLSSVFWVNQSICLANTQSLQAQIPSCQATVDQVLQEIRAKEVKTVDFNISRGTANESNTGNPTNRTDVLRIGMGKHGMGERERNQIENILSSSRLMNFWANNIVKSCGNTAIVVFNLNFSDWIISYYIQSDGTTKEQECVYPPTSNSLPWGVSVCL